MFSYGRLLVLFSLWLLQGFAYAHFQLMYTPELLLDKGGELTLKLPFAHPGSNGAVMPTDTPEAFYQITPSGQNNLHGLLKSIQWQSAENQEKAFEAKVVQKSMGDYVYVLTQAPYFDNTGDLYIQQFTKLITNVGGLPTHWQKPLDLPIEIVPLQTPYKIYAGSTFSGVVMSHGKPLSDVLIEVEYLNYVPDMKKNAFADKPMHRYPSKHFSTLSLMTDKQGVFTFGIPKAGFWGFAAVDALPGKHYKGKPLAQEAVIWVQAKSLD